MTLDLSTVVSSDFETDLIGPGRMAPEPVCLSWAVQGQAPTLVLAKDAPDLYRDWFARELTLTGAHFAFDLGVLMEQAPSLREHVFEHLDRGLVQDVSLNQKLLDIASIGDTDRSYSLAACAGRHGVPCADKSSTWRKEFSALRGVPLSSWPVGATEYVLQDAATPLAVLGAQHAFDARFVNGFGGGPPVLALAGYEARKALALHLISCWGLHAHPERARALGRYVEKFLSHGKYWLLRGKLVREDGSRDTKAAQARMKGVCAAKGIPPARTKKGGISLDKIACADSGDGLLELYAAYSGAANLRARVQDLIQGIELPLQVRFDTLLETGRTSTSKPDPPLVGVQAQNFPRKAGAREALAPREGHVYAIADYSMAESHSLAQLCKDLFGYSVMMDQLNAGRDLHVWFGGKVLGLEYEEALARYKAGDKAMDEARQHAKPCNFGFPGGMGAAKFRVSAYKDYRIRFTLAQAEALRASWLTAYPEMRAYFALVNRILAGADYATIRATRSGRWRGRCGYCQIANFGFQELTAHAAADACAAVQRECFTGRVRGTGADSPLLGSRAVMYTHDEIVLETPRDLGHAAAMRLSEVMEERFNAWHPDCPTQATPLITDVYAKGLKPKYGSDGMLVCTWVSA